MPRRKDYLTEQLTPFIDQCMDLTVGRFQVITSDPKAVREFIPMCKEDVDEFLRGILKHSFDTEQDVRKKKAAEKDGGDGNLDDLLEGGAPVEPEQLSLEAELHSLRNQYNTTKASELYLRSVATDMIKDVDSRGAEIGVLRGTIERRDKMLKEQRLAYIREILHMKEIIRQFRTTGSCELPDATFYNWDHDQAAEQQLEEQQQRIDEALAEQKQKLDQERETLEARHGKVVEDFRKQIATLEFQITQLNSGPVIKFADVEVQTEKEAHRNSQVQTDKMMMPSPPSRDLDKHPNTKQQGSSPSPLNPSALIPGSIQEEGLKGFEETGAAGGAAKSATSPKSINSRQSPTMLGASSTGGDDMTGKAHVQDLLGESSLTASETERRKREAERQSPVHLTSSPKGPEAGVGGGADENGGASSRPESPNKGVSRPNSPSNKKSSSASPKANRPAGTAGKKRPTSAGSPKSAPKVPAKKATKDSSAQREDTPLGGGGGGGPGRTDSSLSETLQPHGSGVFGSSHSQIPPPMAAVATTASGSFDGGMAAALQAQEKLRKDLEMDNASLKEELTKVKGLLSSVRKKVAEKEAECAQLRSVTIDSSEVKLRQEESVAVRKLNAELREKEHVLQAKNEELRLLQEETARWFSNYRKSQPGDQAPINYETLRKLSAAVDQAEASEEGYRTTSWKLLSYLQNQQVILRNQKAECEELAQDRNYPALQHAEHQLDILESHTRRQVLRLRHQRQKNKTSANRLWDTVLYYARSLAHGDKALDPPPYYAIITNNTTSSRAALLDESGGGDTIHSTSPSRGGTTTTRVIPRGTTFSQTTSYAATGETIALAKLQGGVGAVRPQSAASLAATRARLKHSGTLQAADYDPQVVHRPSSADARRFLVQQRSAGTNGRGKGFVPSTLVNKTGKEQREALMELMRRDQQAIAEERTQQALGIYEAKGKFSTSSPVKRNSNVIGSSKNNSPQGSGTGVAQANPTLHKEEIINGIHKWRMYGKQEKIPVSGYPQPPSTTK